MVVEGAQITESEDLSVYSSAIQLKKTLILGSFCFLNIQRKIKIQFSKTAFKKKL